MGWYRSQEDARKAPPGVATVIADFSSRESMKNALAGIDSVYLVCSPIPELVELESNAIEACRQSGVKHLVLNSSLGAGDYPKSFPAWHRVVEDKLKASGLGFTILRPIHSCRTSWRISPPASGSKVRSSRPWETPRTSYLDLRDIAAVVARVLASPGEHLGKTYELNGPEAVTYAELAERIARVCQPGRQICGYTRSRTAGRDAGDGHAGIAGGRIARSAAVLHQGQGGEVTEVLAQLLGQPPVKLDPFLEEFKAGFAA